MHAHICTDVEPPSAPAAPCLAPLCLPPSLPSLLLSFPFNLLFCLCSHSDPPTTTSTLPLFFPGLFIVSPWGFFSEGAPAPLGLTRTWKTLQTPPAGPSAQGEALNQVATPLPLSSRAFPDGRTRSRTGSISDGQPYFSLLVFRGLFVFFFLCARTVKPARELRTL